MAMSQNAEVFDAMDSPENMACGYMV
jgi:hypothetical protein